MRTISSYVPMPTLSNICLIGSVKMLSNFSSTSWNVGLDDFMSVACIRIKWQTISLVMRKTETVLSIPLTGQTG